MRERLSGLWGAVVARARHEDGATAVEYALMVALIALVIVAAVTLVGVNVRTLFESVHF